MKTILLVEDDRNQRMLYEEELTAWGYEVVAAQDGREALLALMTVSPDLVILDIQMPGMDGIEAMSRILKVKPRAPVIINTAYASYKEHFRSWSADACLVKSSDTSELKATIEALLASAMP